MSETGMEMPSVTSITLVFLGVVGGTVADGVTVDVGKIWLMATEGSEGHLEWFHHNEYLQYKKRTNNRKLTRANTYFKIYLKLSLL